MFQSLRTLAIALLFVALSATGAWAQQTLENSDLNVQVDMPAGWSVIEGNDRAVFNFKHDESHSQVEIIATELLTQDVADVFFDTFHETLTTSDFTQSGREEGKAYGTHSGTETIYEFTHSGVTLKVVVYQFVTDATAWLVVAYVQADNFDEYMPTYAQVVASLSPMS